MTPDDEATEVALDVLSLVVHATVGFILGALLSLILTALFRSLSRRNRELRPFVKRLRIPMRLLLIVAGTGLGVLIATGWPRPNPALEWRPPFIHGFTIALIIAGAYVLTGLIGAIQDGVVAKRSDAAETDHSRRIRTQTQVITRVGVAIVWVLAISGALLTFEQFRAIGASMLASAGVLSIVAGLAAQTSLANMFAGIQIAFTDTVRVGDIVIVDDHWGTVDEITLTYVVIESWDGVKWIVPSTEFVSKTFENWTRGDQKLMGLVLFTLDWVAPIEAMRIELQRIVRSTELWDGRRATLQVVDSEGGHVTVRCVVSAATSGQLWDLRCYVREEMIGWFQREAPYAFPRQRVETKPYTAPPLEERQEYIADVMREWEEEKATDVTQPIDMEEEFEQTMEMIDQRRGWFQAMRDRRAANRELRKHNPDADLRPLQDVDELVAGILRDPRQATSDVPPGSGPETARMPRIDDTDGEGSSVSASARLYSGSPEGEALDAKYSGPSPEDQADRERRRKAREQGDEEPEEG